MAAAGIAVTVSMGVMKPLLSKLTTLMGDQYKKLKGLRKEVSFLQRELSAMDVLLERMDAADELTPQAKSWRKEIIEMSYDIEDCIDDFMHRVGEADDNKMGILQKASQYLRTFKDRRRLATQFNEIKTLVIEASERRRRYKLDQCISITTPRVVDPRLSALYNESANLVGIDTLKDELVKWVMDEEKQLKVMSIVGFGGLGKTTLANEVYREVEGQFNCKAVICVSQKPEMIWLFNRLLSKFGLRTYSDASPVQDAIDDLIKHLQDKRYFIVVDDLWDIRAWNTIRCAFPQNSRHSRVVITTRNEDVARACCGSCGFIYKMKPLSEQDSRKLFFNRIFGSENNCPSQLTEISCEILKKCGGLPLAIITVASTLACQPTKLKEQWEYIWNSLATKFARNLTTLEDMMHILDLSYKNLPPNLKACFLYLGTYPEDHIISRVELVRRWVAEGFVSDDPRLNLWEVADIYFTELVNRNMIQPTYDFWGTEISGCRVHDMMLDLIVRRCKEDNFLILANGTRGVAEGEDKVIRRLTADLRVVEDATIDVDSSRNLSQIRSLTIFEGTKWMPPLLELQFVRVLFLYFTKRETTVDLAGISELSQLRYLFVQCNIVLPGQMRGLRRLETLELPRFLRKCNIPSDIVDVPRLSHLMVPMGTRLPDGIGKVKSLRTLRGFSLVESSSESIIGLGKLTALSELDLDHYMRSRPLPPATWMAALGACLEKLGNLKLLSVDFRGVAASCAYCADALSSLSPPFRNLERLRVPGFTFSRVPRWIGHLGNLRELWIGAKQILQEDVAIIGTSLPSLVLLDLRILCVPTERIVIAGSMGFAVLKEFRFNCDGISHLTFETGAMPELRELCLRFNPDKWDKATPVGLRHLPSLNEIRVCRRGYQAEQGTKAEVALMRGVFRDTAGALPTRPEVIFRGWIPGRKAICDTQSYFTI